MKDRSIQISIDQQQLDLLEEDQVIASWPVSTALKGAGSQENSHRTPTGSFTICEAIGSGLPEDTCFEGRKAVGEWDGSPSDCDLILSRILRLDGNEAANSNTRDRYIYIHGTNHEDRIGQPTSCGCIRMTREDMVQLFEEVGEGTRVTILEPSQPRENLIFFDCDSTLSTIEGIDELARSKGEETFRKVEELTHAAMNGEVPVEEVFGRRIEMIEPNLELSESIAQLYIDTMTSGVSEVVQQAKAAGWRPIILSGGFAPLIEPLAKLLGIEHVEAVPLHFSEDGTYAGFGEDYPTTRNGGKPDIIREWKNALHPNKVIMVGDGNSDLEAQTECDAVVGYGGVVAREAVKNGADYWITSMSDFPSHLFGGDV